MSITAQLLGVHRLAVAPSIHIFCEGPRLLVNAGENVQRFHLEKKLHIHRTTDIFVTSLSPHSIAGLVGLLLSLEGTGASSVTLWGPHGLRDLLQLAKSSFAGLHQLEINYRLVGPSEAPASLTGAAYCTDGVCSGLCRPRRKLSGSSSSSSSSGSSSNNNNKSKGPRTCACSYGPAIKGTASGIPVDAYFLPHSSRRQQEQQAPSDNPLLCSSNSSNSNSSSSNSNSSNSSSESSTTGSTEATEDEGATKKRRLGRKDGPSQDPTAAEPIAAATASAAAAAATTATAAGECPGSGSAEAARAALFGDFGDATDCVFLLLRSPTLPGRFYPEKAKALGIPPGPTYAKLKSGEKVQLADGRWIDPTDVCSEPQPGKAFAFVECLEPQQALRAAECFRASQSGPLAGVFHLSPIEVARSPEYAALVKALSSADTKHVCCNMSHVQTFSSPFLHAARLSRLLHLLMPPLFPRRPEMQEETIPRPRPPQALPCPPEAELHVEPLAKLWLSPPTRPFLEDSQKPAEQPPSPFESLFSASALEDVKRAFSSHLPPAGPPGFRGPCLRVLGTGSAAPSHYRNVSASILQLTDGLSVALDFGEGSLSQLRAYTETEDEFTRLLLSLQFIFVSHSHADHHLGVLPLLQCRAALWPQARAPVLIAPSRLQEWFAAANERMAAMPHHFVSCDCLLASLDEPFSAAHLPPAAAAAWTGEAGALEIRTVEVDHIPESYGVRLDFEGLSFVYSGDTRPAAALFSLAANCTALLHEATFEDGLHAEAEEKKHSCIGEVLEGAAQCGCEAVILTHFSQRYPKIPHMPQSERGPQQQETGGADSSAEEEGGGEAAGRPAVLVAFDGILLPLQHLKRVAPCFSLLPPVLNNLFGSASEASHA